MIKEGKFGVNEAVSLVIIATTSKVFLAGPATLAEIVGTATWLSSLISGAVAFAGFGFIYLLLKRFPGRDLVEIFDISFGRALGFIFSCVLAIFMFISTLIRMNESREFLHVFIYPMSPNWLLSGLFILCVFVLSLLGLESIARLAKLLIYFMIASFLLAMIMGIPNYDMNNLFPILGKGLDKIAPVGVLGSSVYGDVIILAIFAKSLQGHKFIKREGIIGIFISFLIVSAALLATSLTFPHYVLQETTAAVYELTTIIDLGRYLQRVEAIFIFARIFNAIIANTVSYYAFLWIFCNTFKISDKRPVVISSCIVLFASTFLQKDITSVVFGRLAFFHEFGSSLLLFGLPVLALITAKLRKKGGEIECAS